ncbi:unnamed protein product [Enterobius vermicularis]|uniref:RING finger and SPRY domain-containing protein 1 n=1 Tax=Enterobius vermicularis TaxID=51028 RepID=A0A0N4V759_ENTVE|nr:unnamed protein product [Enterobius vermicularis]
MGSCLCKRKRVPASFDGRLPTTSFRIRSHQSGTIDIVRTSRGYHSTPNRKCKQISVRCLDVLYYIKSSFISFVLEISSHEASAVVTSDVKDLIKQTLQLIRSLVNNEQAPPSALLKLNLIADKESGWLMVVMCLIDVVPDDDPLGPAVMTLFLDESPLPTKETVLKLITRHMRLDERRPRPSSWYRNVCIVLGCLAEKLAGSGSVQICTDITLNFLIDNLKSSNDPQVIIHSMIALEKFAQTSENRATVCRRLNQCSKHPLMLLEAWRDSVPNDYMKQQVAFCAQWSLDNIFVVESRELSYLHCNVANINAMLNHEDVSEYLKIGSDGLEARCDASSFESVRCTFEATEGRWYYEALILTSGVMQIGFATKRSRFCNHEGYGIGDDDCSLAYDGCRQLLWYNARSEKHDHPPWKPGDILGCLIDISNKYVMFYLNGVPLPKPHFEFLTGMPEETGYFAAASFMSFQQCRFNFGHMPFRRRKMELAAQTPIAENSCNICFANPIDTTLKPCGHGGFCSVCANQMETCPLCRVVIMHHVRLNSDVTEIHSKQLNNNYFKIATKV